MTDAPTNAQFDIAIELVNARAEVVRLTKERDGLTAVIASALGIFGRSIGLPMWRTLDKIVLALRHADPTATLAARDTEKKAEGWDEGYETGYDDRLFDDRGSSGDPDAHEYPHSNPYRTPQQGEPEHG